VEPGVVADTAAVRCRSHQRPPFRHRGWRAFATHAWVKIDYLSLAQAGAADAGGAGVADSLDPCVLDVLA
jgi:hypothetical protein